jgi:hypothetical protein
MEVHPNSLDRVRALRFRHATTALVNPSYWLNKFKRPFVEICYWRALSEFASAALADRPAKPDLIDGLQLLAIIEAAERSAAQACKISLAYPQQLTAV